MTFGICSQCSEGFNTESQAGKNALEAHTQSHPDHTVRWDPKEGKHVHAFHAVALEKVQMTENIPSTTWSPAINKLYAVMLCDCGGFYMKEAFMVSPQEIK